MRILTLNEQGLVAGGRMLQSTAQPDLLPPIGNNPGGGGGYDGVGDAGAYGGLGFAGGTYNGLDVVDLPGPVVSPSSTDIADASGCISMATAEAFGETAEGAVFALGSAGGGAVTDAVPESIANLVKKNPIASAGAGYFAGKLFSNIFLAPGRAYGQLYGSAYDALLDMTNGNQACIVYEAQK